MSMIKPVLQHERFVDSVKAAANLPSGYRLWWLGQSGFLLQYNQRHVLLDPYLSESLSTRYATTGRPHIRMMELICPPEELNFIDIVACTHHHDDHMDGPTLRGLMWSNPTLVVIVPEAHRKLAADKAETSPSRLTGIDVARPVRAGGIVFHAVPSAHETVDRNADGEHLFLGYVLEMGEYRVYHAGDTVMYDGLVENIRTAAGGRDIDVAILPINGRRPERQVPGNLWGEEAAKLARDIGARVAVPCHHQMFTYNTETPDEFVAACQKLSQPYRLPQCGEPLQFG